MINGYVFVDRSCIIAAQEVDITPITSNVAGNAIPEDEQLLARKSVTRMVAKSKRKLVKAQKATPLTLKLCKFEIKHKNKIGWTPDDPALGYCQGNYLFFFFKCYSIKKF